MCKHLSAQLKIPDTIWVKIYIKVPALSKSSVEKKFELPHTGAWVIIQANILNLHLKAVLNKLCFDKYLPGIPSFLP